MIALVDCNNFFVSCERLFAPRLRGRPVVVLSNNDGCVISRSNEAKAIPVAMGQPAFELRALVDGGHLVACSANFGLYADLSRRVMRIIADGGHRCEVASVDEAYLDLSGEQDPAAVARRVREQVGRYVGLPVSIGIAPTRTLAKLAADRAKKRPDGVATVGAGGRADLAGIAVADIWGIGGRLAARLHAAGITDAATLAATDEATLRDIAGLPLARTAAELRGISCLPLVEQRPAQQQLMVSRSFGAPINAWCDLRQAVAAFAERAGARLRAASLTATACAVQLEHGERSDARQVDGGRTVFPVPTSHTGDLIAAAVAIAQGCWRPAQHYRKAGVCLVTIPADGARQLQLFDIPGARERRDAAMRVMDHINARHGAGSIASAAAGLGRPLWGARQQAISPDYTTDWDAIPRLSVRSG